MGEIRSLRITNPELENWIEEHIPRGDLNPIMNNLLLRYRQEQDQEYRENIIEEATDRKITIFQGIVFLSVAIWMLVFATSQFYDLPSIIATFFLVTSGVLLSVYVIFNNFRRKEINKEAA